MNKNRFLGLILTVLISLVTVGLTSPTVLNGIKLGLDLQGGFEILYEAEPLVEGSEVTKDALRQTAKSLMKRADKYGVAEPEIAPEGSNRIRARIAGVSDEATVREIMKKPADLTFRGPDGAIEMRGSDFKEGAAQIAFNELNQPIILIEVNEKEKWADVTRRLLGQPLAIYLDDELISAPVVRDVLTDGRATISGSYSLEEARELAEIINLGALPLKLTEKYTQSVGATLGKQSLEQTAYAGILATIFILLFMMIVYRLPGVIASVTLIVYNWGILLIYYWMNATLTLPGIAAYVLGVGMAVDANIITAERIREEMRSGKSLLSALKSGSRNSLRTIIDANATTTLAGAVLYFVGTGAIQGFALMLILSNVFSMVTNVAFSRFMLNLLVRSNVFRKPGYYNVKEKDIRPLSEKKSFDDEHYYRIFDFVKHRKIFFSISSALTVIGIVSLLVFGLNFGVDFKAGTSMDILVGKAVTQAEAESLIREAGFEAESVVVGGGGERVSIRFGRVLDAEQGEASKLLSAFRAAYGDQVSAEENTVDPVIAQELGVRAIIAILCASVGIIALVMLRFEWRFALAGIIALLHDAFFVVTVFSVLRLEVNLPFIAAVLTIIGYSINDTIVIFDRIRENMRFAKLRTFDDLCRLVNVSMSQTLVRSINTGLQVLVASLLLLLFGSESIRLFSLAMTLGMAIGMYSSIYIAAQIWIVLKWRSMQKKPAAPAAETA
jgi:SecD/SecF fusion protein